MNEDEIIDEFLKSNWRNQWLELPYGNIYLRKSMRFILREKIRAVDLASAEFHEGERGKGHFTRLLEKIEAKASEYGYHLAYAECVHNKRLADFYLKRGYVPHEYHELCFWKKI